MERLSPGPEPETRQAPVSVQFGSRSATQEQVAAHVPGIGLRHQHGDASRSQHSGTDSGGRGTVRPRRVEGHGFLTLRLQCKAKQELQVAHLVATAHLA